MTKFTYSSEREYNGYLRVNSCGKQWLTDRNYDTLREKGRIDFSISYILKGMGYCEVNNAIIPIPEGGLVLYYPKVKQHYSFKKEDSTVMLWSHFSGTAACQLLENLSSSSAIIINIQDRKQFESVFEKMIIAHYKKAAFSDSICEGYMTVLLSLIAQSNMLTAPSNTQNRNANLEIVLSHMHIHYNKPIDIKEYAKVCCTSEDHFIRIFKAYTGLPPYRYQLKIRIDRAIEMLENLPINISECAEAVGFNDTAYFSRVFKKFTGHPPSYYK